MKTNQETQNEYNKFMIEFMHKIQEIKQDFNKLSDENKCRVKNELEEMVGVRGLTTILEHNIIRGRRRTNL